MRHEERVTYDTTPSGGQSVTTESVPVYSKRELRAMDRHAHRLGRGNKTENKRHGGNVFLRLFIQNPYILLTIAGIIIIFVVYLVVSANSYMSELVTLYQSLSARPTDSKVGFDKRLFFVTVTEDGTVNVTVGAKSEEQLAEAEAAEEEAVSGESPASPMVLDQEAVEVESKLTNAGYVKAHDLACLWQIMTDLGYPVNARIGLMANANHEGRHGLVEYAFSTSHAGGFDLPNGNTTVTSIADIEYLGAWDSTSKNKVRDINGKEWSLGSCGFGSVQWSYGRRINYVNICKQVMLTDADITEENWAETERRMYSFELAIGGGYYKDTIAGLSRLGVDPAVASASQWAEAFCDKYIRPSGVCASSMSGTGSACKERMSTAEEIATILSR